MSSLCLTLYKRIASARDTAALRELQVEMIDRFGLLPTPIKNLFEIAGLRQIAERVGITRLDFGPQGGRMEFAEDTHARPEALIQLIQEQKPGLPPGWPHTSCESCCRRNQRTKDCWLQRSYSPGWPQMNSPWRSQIIR